ncbi:MAG: nucleotidyltransferase family protein, partial [Clostridia bacterium]|nr:nucleotidyltransferase family protein [Clostridia bacterium]
MNECQSSLLECLSAAVRGNSNPGTFSVVSGKAADLLSLADRHSLLPLIVQHLLKTDAVPLPDKPVIDAARVKVIQQAQRTADLELLLDHLKKAGLRPVIMKGIVCRDLYPVPSERPSVDEDFLISPGEAGDYHRELTAYGFRASAGETGIAGADEVTYFSTECRMCVEVHILPFPRNQTAYAHLNKWLEGAVDRAVEQRCGRIDLLTLCPTDHLIYMLFHVYKHFLHGGFGIRQVCDIGLFAEKNIDKIDWDGVRQVCREAGIYTFAAAVFAIAMRHLLGETPLVAVLDADVLAGIDEMPLLDDIMESGVYGASTMSRMHSSTITLGAAEKALNKTNSGGAKAGLLKTVFPPLDYMRGAYPF